MSLLQSPRQATLGNSLDWLQLQMGSQADSRWGGWCSLAKHTGPVIPPRESCHATKRHLISRGTAGVASPQKEGDILFGTAKEETIGHMRRPEVPEQKDQFKIHLEWELPRPSL